MSYLIDTNIISEIRKGKRTNANVARWYATVSGEDLYLSVLVLGEIRQGVERCRERDPTKAASLEKWLQRIKEGFGPRVLGISQIIAEEWGKMNAYRSLPTVESLLAATAHVHDLVLVTRNIAFVEPTGVRFLNPFLFTE